MLYNKRKSMRGMEVNQLRDENADRYALKIEI